MGVVLFTPKRERDSSCTVKVAYKISSFSLNLVKLPEEV